MKKCSKCNKFKEISSYYKEKRSKDGLYARCKSCHYQLTSTNQKSAKYKRYASKYRKEWIKKSGNREKQKKYLSGYMNEYMKNRKREDVAFRMACLLRVRLYHAIKKEFKSGSSVKDLGCSVEELKKWIEGMFKEGMTWQNQGEWHLDHIRPLSSFDLTDRDELLRACHYTNLQPLWAKENISKGNR